MCLLYGGRLWFKCSCGTWKKCPLYGVSALERLCYKGFLRNSSGTKFFVRFREVSALEVVRFREVPLYHTFSFKTYISLIRVLKSKKKKLVLTSFYCPGQETKLDNSWKLLCIKQSRFLNFLHVRKFKNV